MQQFREVHRRAAKLEFEVRFHLIEEIAPGAGVERRALGQRGFDRLAQKVALEYADMLDPRAMLADKRVAAVPLRQGLITQLHQFQFKKGQVLAAQRAQFAIEFRMLRLDRGVGQVRALAQE